VIEVVERPAVARRESPVELQVVDIAVPHLVPVVSPVRRGLGAGSGVGRG
jgi:hypothetical protein